MFVTLPWLLNALAPNAGNDDTCRRRLAAGELVLKEKPLVTIVTPHTPKTLARYVAELRQKVTITTVKIEVLLNVHRCISTFTITTMNICFVCNHFDFLKKHWIRTLALAIILYGWRWRWWLLSPFLKWWSRLEHYKRKSLRNFSSLPSPGLDNLFFKVIYSRFCQMNKQHSHDSQWKYYRSHHKTKNIIRI